MEASLYVHVPLCHGKCDYCDFYSVPVKPGSSLPEHYVSTLLADAERLFEKLCQETSDPLDRFPTVYIGGGTPSVLGPEGMLRLLKGISSLVARVSPPPMEFTVEANPETADEAFLAAIREGGATRLSLGVQTSYGPSRRAVHRIGDEALLPGRLALAAEYFPGAFSADLISGLPLQSEKILLDDVAALASYKPAHVSLYALTLKPGSSLAVPDRDEADRLWISGRDALEKSGYTQYEVSNFSLKGKESLHNIRYWRMKNWLALGPAASGTIIKSEGRTGFRYTIPADINAWLAEGGSGFFQEPGLVPVTEELDAITLMREMFLMGFRYIEGPDEESFQRRFCRSIGDVIPTTLSVWRSRSFLQKDKYALTKEGLLFLDPFLLEAFREIDESFSESNTAE